MSHLDHKHVVLSNDPPSVSGSMPHCRDCRWWDEDRPRVEPYPGFDDSWRVCALLSGEEYAQARARTDGSEIVTAPDFGCVQFEERA